MNKTDRQQEAAPPNIIFIHAESMDGRKMGCVGHPAMKNATPNLDTLAARGTLFTNAYTNCPVCNPSRASMWTGKYPHYYNCWNNHEGLREEVPTLLTALDRAGYLTKAIGPLDFAWGKHSIRDCIGSWTRSANIPRPISRTPLPVVIEDRTPYPKDRDRTQKAIDWLKDAANDARPFFLYLTTGLVHPAFVAHTSHMKKIAKEHIAIPPDLGGIKSTTHPVMRYMRITKNCVNCFSEEMVRRIRHIYFAMISALDEMIGSVLKSVRDLGLEGDTFIIFSSDHGEMAGEHNQILKRSMYEPSCHVPLIVSGPGIGGSAEIHNPVSLVDLYPTILDMAEVNCSNFNSLPGFPKKLDGESLMPMLTGDPAKHRDWVFSEYNGDRCNTGAYMLRRGQYKYIDYVGYPPQLFDLDKDPWEVENLAVRQPGIVDEMKSLLQAHFDCEEIDRRAKVYDRREFLCWRDRAITEGTYRKTMARVYSGFDRMCIEDILPWTDQEEALIKAWLNA